MRNKQCYGLTHLLAEFYKGMAKNNPQLTQAAEDFFSQHPNLR